jgi:Secretion system C-terminal sorting domain
VNGYPQSWTVYSVQISGVTGTVTGRFAFRYNVPTNAGPTGANGNFVGIDAVQYTLPCGVTAGSYTTCAGNSVTILTSGGLPSTTYLWSNSATTSSIAVTPTATTVYTLTTSNSNGPCPNPVTATVTLGTALSMNLSASANTVCAGRTVTLTASGATTYSWNTGGTSAIITVTPNTTTTYSVGGLNGTCIGGNTISITALALPNLSVSSSASISCPGTTLGLASSGAAFYTWVLGNSAVSGSLVTITTGSNPAGGTFTVGLIGTDNNGCTSSGVITRTTAPSPTVVVTSSPSVQCVNKIAALSVTGASTYTWSGSTTSNSSSVSFSNGATAGPKSFTIVGTSTAGCTASTTLAYTVSACTGIQKINGNYLESSVFPNPFNSELTISGIVGRVEIYNALGELVLNVTTTENETINTSNLTKGAYILRAYTDESDVRTIKLIKE